MGQVRGVPPEQWTDRMGQAEAWGCYRQPAMTQSPAGALGSGCRRHRWATASRLLGAKVTVEQKGQESRPGPQGLTCPLSIARAQASPPGEWLVGARGMAPAKLDPRSHGTAGPGHRGGGGCPAPRLRAHAGHPAGEGCLSLSPTQGWAHSWASAWVNRPHPNGPMTMASSQAVPRPGSEVRPWAGHHAETTPLWLAVPVG